MMWLYAIICVLIILVIWNVRQGRKLREQLWKLHHATMSKVASVASDQAAVAAVNAHAAVAPASSAVAPTPSPVVAPAPSPAAPVEKFCPKLAHRMGFCDAGAKPEHMNPARGTFYDKVPSAALPLGPMYYQGFSSVRSNDVFRVEHPAENTQWSGYMHGSVLPGV